MSPKGLIGIRHLALECSNLDVMKRFYCELLGYRVVWQPSENDLYLSLGDDNLALHQTSPEAVQPASHHPLDHLGIAAASPEDVDAWANHLLAHGVDVLRAPMDHRDGSRSFYARDPEGNVIQVIHLPPSRP